MSASALWSSRSAGCVHRCQAGRDSPRAPPTHPSALIRAGAYAGPELVRDLMRELGLVVCQPRPWRLTTVSDPLNRAR
jgi:hypothetical protein